MILVAIAVIVPWLALLPVDGTLGLATATIGVLAALHGWGLLVQRLARAGTAPAALVIHWGLAAMVALGGLALVTRQFGHAVQLALVLGGIALHGGLLVLDRRARALQLDELFRSPERRYWIVPAVGVVIVASLHILGTAGDVTSSPFDDDGNLLAQLQRLADTGTLADPIGFARASQLGGHAVTSGFVTALTGGNWLRVVDGLGFALCLWLGIAQIRPRTAAASIWAVLLIFVAASYPSVATDATPRWLATSLLLALFSTFERYAGPEDDRELWPLGLLGAAAAALRSELAPVAIAILASAGLLAIGRSGGRRRTLALAVVPLASCVPYALDRFLARASVPAQALERAPGVLVPLVLFLGALVFVVWIVVAAMPGVRRWIALAALVGVAAIVTQISGARPYATQFIWPIAVSAVLALGIGALRTSALDPRGPALVFSLLATVLIYDGRDVAGRARWSRRYSELASGIEYVRHAYPSVSRPDPYGALLAKVPVGATVAIWVARPELVDTMRHRIFDLRTPRNAVRRVTVLRALHPDYALVELDHLAAERARRSLWHRLACPAGAAQAFCTDDLEALVSNRPAVASEGTVHLVRLRP